MNIDYTELFRRNSGIFTTGQQERIRKARILIIGDSGVGEGLAVTLARSGCEHLILAGNDKYAPADMNRQMCCFADTVGLNKISVIRDCLRSINPGIDVRAYHALPHPREIDGLVSQADIVIPAVDDLAYSVLIFRSARKGGKAGILCLPSGALGWISVFTPRTVAIEDCFGVPGLDYEGLAEVMGTPEFKCAQYNYITGGDWRVDWYRDYFSGKRPLALICAVEWLAVSLAALETLKVASGKWPPQEAPRCWYIRKGNVSSSHFSKLMKYHRKLGWLIFGRQGGKCRHEWTRSIWRHIFKYLQYRQDKRDGA